MCCLMKTGTDRQWSYLIKESEMDLRSAPYLPGPMLTEFSYNVMVMPSCTTLAPAWRSIQGKLLSSSSTPFEPTGGKITSSYSLSYPESTCELTPLSGPLSCG